MLFHLSQLCKFAGKEHDELITISDKEVSKLVQDFGDHMLEQELSLKTIKTRIIRQKSLHYL